jgi:hypothetical protein
MQPFFLIQIRTYNLLQRFRLCVAQNKDIGLVLGRYDGHQCHVFEVAHILTYWNYCILNYYIFVNFTHFSPFWNIFLTQILTQDFIYRQRLNFKILYINVIGLTWWRRREPNPCLYIIFILITIF